jgi:hypothetical protein
MTDKLDDLLVELIESHADRVRVLELFAELRVENERLASDADHYRAVWRKSEAENERLRARLCYVNPDGSHVRGCARPSIQHSGANP